jgi:hypothetical protein
VPTKRRMTHPHRLAARAVVTRRKTRMNSQEFRAVVLAPPPPPTRRRRRKMRAGRKPLRRAHAVAALR